jgi:tetratricopeptide (TPR) repeat protein
MFFRFVSFLLLLSAFFDAALGQGSGRNLKKEQLILDKLSASAPEAVPTFQHGTEAMDKEDYTHAVQLYREVVQQVPMFSPALRRLGFCLAATGQTEEGLKWLENAVTIERSPENLASLAETLAYPSRGKEGSEAQKARALALAREASQRDQASDDPRFLLLAAQLAFDLQDEPNFRQTTQTLLRKYPDRMETHYFNAILLAMEKSWIGAEDEIKEAGRLGLPPQAVQAFLASGIQTRATAWRWVNYALYLLAGWGCGLVLLFVAGKLFSQITLVFIEKSDPNVRVSPAEAILRSSYRALINIAGSYYYFSIPVVIFLVLAVTGSIVYGFLVLGHIPIKLVVILVVAAIVTVYKMVQSLFIKVRSEDPGRSLRPDEAPGLWQLTREVADDLGTRPLDDIRLLPGTEMAVYERGTYRERRKDLGRRILLMGLGLLPGFNQTAFRSVLAHEYGHLSHRDTAGGDVALRVNQDMMKFAYSMACAGQAVWWNIAFQFLRVYHFLFRRISYGATRLQEVLADRAAARIYGAQAFEEGLRHVVRRQIEFTHLADEEIAQALKSGRPLQNVYTLESQREKTVEETIDNALNRQTSEEDTHPSPADRFRLVKYVSCSNQVAPSGNMWDLFPNRDAITKEMSSQIEQMVKAAVA